MIPFESIESKNIRIYLALNPFSSWAYAQSFKVKRMVYCIFKPSIVYKPFIV